MALDSLKARWKQKTGYEMPPEIEGLHLARIRRAVELTEKGITVFVPTASVTVDSVENESMVAWDKHGEFG